jgi:MFS family permease
MPVSSKDNKLWSKNFVLLLSGSMLQAFSAFMLLPIIPLFVVGPLKADEWTVGVAVAVLSAMIVLSRPLAGYLLDRHGRLRWLLIASIVYSLALFSYSAVTSVVLLVIVRLFQGAGWGVVTIAGATIAADLVPESMRGRGMGYYGITLPLALTCGPMIGMWILDGFSYSAVFYTITLLAIAGILCLVAIKTPEIDRQVAKFSLRNIFEKRVTGLFFFLLFLCMGYGGLIAFLPLYAPQVGFSGAGPLYALYGLSVILSRIVAGGLHDNKGPLVPVCLGLVMLALGWWVLGATTSKVIIMFASFLLGMGIGLVMPCAQAMVVDMVSINRRGAGLASLFLSVDLGIAVGALVFGALIGIFPIALVFQYTSVLVLVAAGIFLLIVYPKYKKQVTKM